MDELEKQAFEAGWDACRRFFMSRQHRINKHSPEAQKAWVEYVSGDRVDRIVEDSVNRAMGGGDDDRAGEDEEGVRGGVSAGVVCS